MQSVLERFLRYVSFDTQSNENTGTHPSTPGQTVFANVLTDELRQMGLHADVTGQAYVYAELPATPGWEHVPALGWIAHLDTSDAASGKDVHPQVIKWDGGDIALGSSGLVIHPKEEMRGKHIITTDGTTLLGADDKAGIAEIMTAAERILKENRPHGPVKIAFTPDEEIGAGADFFDIPKFGAKYAFTMDGGGLGGIEYENFNAAKTVIHVHGCSTHPGSAKNIMRNAQTIAMEFHSMLPPSEVPEHTCGYEGFYHLCNMRGNVGHAELEYILRTFDAVDFDRRKETIRRIAEYLNRKYGKDTVIVEIRDQYRNMAEIIQKTPFILDFARQAMERAGVRPFFTPIRGGTDGARLSREGLPCPNLCTGGHCYHGETEYAVVEEMESCVEILLNLVDVFRQAE